MDSSNSSLVNVNGILYNISQIYYNGTEIDTFYCTADTCSLLLGIYTYLPNIPGNVFFAALFAILMVANIFLGIHYRTWGILFCMTMGLALESAAYTARILIHQNDFSRNLFIVYIYCITLGATFLSAAIYLCLARIVVVYGENISRLKPRTCSILFLFGDFIALSLQGAGGGMVQVDEVETAGLYTLVAGLAFQVFSLLAFATICADLAWRVRYREPTLNPTFQDLRCRPRWTGFLLALVVATVGIIVRSSYRIAELQAGFHSDLFNDQVLFMTFEATVMSIVALSLTIFHPGIVFKKEWRVANYVFRTSRVVPQKD